MRITKIEIGDFRGFKGPAPFTLCLMDGKNLLLYGENGSGKSTIALALDRVVRTRSHGHKADANRFRLPDSETGVAVKVTFADGCSYTYGNKAVPDSPGIEDRLKDARLRCGFLGYRALLRTSFYSGLAQHSLFRLLVEEILSEHLVIIDGSLKPLGDYWHQLEQRKPRRHRKYNVPEYHRRIGEFNRAFAGALADIEARARSFLDHFHRQKVQLRLHYDGAKYDENARARKLVDGAVVPHVEFGGASHPDCDAFLNEARLSCLALSLHLASVSVRDVAPISVADPLRLLCLDDVLIGLDMSNRCPVLAILRGLDASGQPEKTPGFRDFQIVLTTYDRHWFEVAKLELGDDWIKAELYEAEDDQGHPKPVLIMPSLSDYDRAKAYFALKDYPACGNYLRKVCEEELIRFLPERRRRRLVNGQIGYARMLGELYDEFMKCLTEHGCGTTPFQGFPGVKDALLNRLSHADIATPIYRGELETAFELADRLRALRSVVVAPRETELVVAKRDASGVEWRYLIKVQPWDAITYLDVDGTGWFDRCEARPLELMRDGVRQKLCEFDDKIPDLYKHYCHHTKVTEATPYEDFVLPDGKSLMARCRELLPPPPPP